MVPEMEELLALLSFISLSRSLYNGLVLPEVPEGPATGVVGNNGPDVGEYRLGGGVDGCAGVAIRLPRREGRPPVAGEVCRDDEIVVVDRSLRKWREPTIPYAIWD
jgi:hypothetical protein